MPKTNDATGATYAGYEGVVEHAGGAGSTRPGGLSELDPSRNLDGSVVDGFDSEERELSDTEGSGVVGEVRPVEQPTDSEPLDAREDDSSGDGDKPKEEVPSSVGTSFSGSSKNSESSSAKSTRSRR